MTTLSVTVRGQVTFRKEVLRHLGVEPGGKIELELLPDGRGLNKSSPAGGNDRRLHRPACGTDREHRHY